MAGRHKLSTCITPIFKLDLHLGPNYTHAKLQCYRTNEILFISCTNTQAD